MQIDIEALRRTTEEAVRRGQEQRQAQLEAEQLEAERKRKEEELKAKVITDQVPSRCQTEAAAGRRFAIVMSFGESDYQRPRSQQHEQVRGEWLIGVARLVFDACDKAKMRPTIEFWHDGGGMNSGYNILVHW